MDAMVRYICNKKSLCACMRWCGTSISRSLNLFLRPLGKRMAVLQNNPADTSTTTTNPNPSPNPNATSSAVDKQFVLSAPGTTCNGNTVLSEQHTFFKSQCARKCSHTNDCTAYSYTPTSSTSLAKCVLYEGMISVDEVAVNASDTNTVCMIKNDFYATSNMCPPGFKVKSVENGWACDRMDLCSGYDDREYQPTDTGFQCVGVSGS